jgi:glycoprotein-N-acetylgalactosamine 3-beta-galactosyltransferase
MKENYRYNILQPPGLNETLNKYDKLTDKVFLTIKYLYHKYNNYDWYLKVDDDTWIFIDNLRKFLSDKNASMPVTYGYDFKLIVEKGYHSGGAGYVLSNEAFSRLGYALNNNYSFCKNTGTEDVDVAICLRKLQVYKNSSLDELERERFHPLNIEVIL